MKKFISLFLSLTMLFSLTAGLDFSAYAAASGDCTDTIKYSYDESNFELTLSGQGDLDSLGDFDQLYDISNVTSVIVQKGIISIGNSIFSEFTNLKNVELPDGLLSIGDSAFYDCNALTSINIPDTVKKIDDWAFAYCGLKSIYIPGNNVCIGEYAFRQDYKPMVLCHSATKFDQTGYNKVIYIDKIISVNSFKKLYENEYDSDNTTMYSFVANESAIYYAGDDCLNTNCVFDENFNLVESTKINSTSDEEIYDNSGYSFNLQKGHTYYFPYGGSADYFFKIIKDYQYLDNGKRYIQGDYNYNCLKVVYPDDSSQILSYDGRDNNDVSKLITLQYCGKTVSFKLNNPITFDSFEVLNSECINDDFIAAVKAHDGKVLGTYPLIYRLHLSDGKTYDIKNYSMRSNGGGMHDGEVWTGFSCEAVDGRTFYIGFVCVNKTSNQIIIDINNGDFKPNPTVLIESKSHTHSWNSGVITKKATTTANGVKTYTCSICKSTKTETIYKVLSVNLSKTTYTYNGKVQKPSVTVKDSKGKTLKNGTDYTVSYPNGMKNVGRYSVKITFKGNYSGTKTLTYNINPKGTSMSKLTAAKKGFKATWKKQSTQTTGYQLQYSTSSNFKKGTKTVNISKNKTTSKSVGKLSAKKKYYVRVRTYKTVKFGGKNVKLYSGWSKAKAVTTKK